MAKEKIIAIAVPVTITAAESEGESKSATFDVLAYNGGALMVGGWEYPVVIDLAGLQFSRSIVANLDHDERQRVGHVTDKSKSEGELKLSGVFSAATQWRDEVVQSAQGGFGWEASVEVRPSKIVEVEAGKTVKVNGREFTGPLSIARKGTLSGFAFVSHGADPNTDVKIAATAAPQRGKTMKTEVAAWIKATIPSLDIESLSDQEVANLEADYEGRQGTRTNSKKVEASNPFESRKIEAKRRGDIRSIADKFIERREDDLDWIEAIEKMHDHAIEASMSAQEFRTELYESMVPLAHTVPAPRTRDRGLNARILEAAICQAGRLATVEKQFSDQELQLAKDRFPHGISLNEFFIVAAEANGFRGHTGGRMNIDVQRAAFGMTRDIRATGFSTIDVANITGAVANKFLHEGWMAIDLTPLRIAAIRPVRNFQEVTSVSLTGALQYEKLGPAGEIKHGTLDELTYGGKAETYATMMAITRQDIINDDLGALTAVPRRMGRGGALTLNHIFWTRFLALVGESFFAAGNNNINTGVADMTLGGLEATETIFMNQTDPDGKPLGIMPKIVLVPTALKAKANALMSDQPGVFITGASATIPAANVFAGRFRVESSPYISNTSYTGNTAVAWWMLADPNELAVIEIQALNGRVEPVVETADADFNVLGVQMRGYCDIGVREQEKRAGVHADGGAS